MSYNAYADDQHMYCADSDHATLYASQDHKSHYSGSGFQLLVLASTEQDFSFNIDGQQIKKCDDVDL